MWSLKAALSAAKILESLDLRWIADPSFAGAFGRHLFDRELARPYATNDSRAANARVGASIWLLQCRLMPV